MDADKRTAAWDAVIPSYVRYNDQLCPNAKLLYAEIRALSNRSGYCFASNRYLADILHISERSIARQISQLAELGFVVVKVCRDERNGKVTGRKIFADVYSSPVEECDECSENDVLSNMTEMADGDLKKPTFGADGRGLPCEMDASYDNLQNSRRTDGNPETIDMPETDTSVHMTEMSGGGCQNCQEGVTKLAVSQLNNNINNIYIPPKSPKRKKSKKAVSDELGRKMLTDWAMGLFGNQSESFVTCLMEFCDHRRKLESPVDDIVAKRLIRRILSFSNGGDMQIMMAIMDKSIMNNWRDIYPLKPDELRRFLPPPATQTAQRNGGKVRWL